MRKVKIIKASSQFDYDGYYESSLFHPVAGDWEEVSDKEYGEIRDALLYANRESNRDFHYIIVEYSEKTKDEMFASASDFKEQMKKKKEKENKAREVAKQKRDEKAQERKRKQLEKLKKELGEG